MAISSGYSIQRNEIIDIQHRQQLDYFDGGSYTKVYPLKSKPDFTNKEWSWGISVGGFGYSIDRSIGVNSLDSTSSVSGSFSGEITEWNNKNYTEGSADHSVMYDSQYGTFGAIVFNDLYLPDIADDVRVTYQEHQNNWTGSNGGLLYQLARDLCVHPYETSEIVKVIQTYPVDNNNAPIAVGAETGYRVELAQSWEDDYAEINTGGTQRVLNKVWKVVREHKTDLGTKNISAVTNSNEVLLGNVPFTLSDLGDGEFKVSLNGRVIPQSWLVFDTTPSMRTTSINLRVDVSDITWIDTAGLNTVDVVVAFHWKHSVETPYGALFGPTGFGPEQEALSSNDYSFTANTHYTQYNDSTNEKINVVLKYDSVSGDFVVNSTITDDTSPEYVNVGDIILTEFDNKEEFRPGFNLIYPMPASNHKSDVEFALKNITNKFLVESAKGVDLLSDDELSSNASIPTSVLPKPQKWRIRFEYFESSESIKVNIATPYQLKDDMEITSGQSRDGIKSPIFREPGELCDVYNEPAAGRGNTLTITKNKSNFFRRFGKHTDDVGLTYPLSYRLTVSDHGVGFFMWDQASVDQDDDYAWFVAQRHVNNTTGQPEWSGKSPVHCVYSPTKRPVELADLEQYYNGDDLTDLTKQQTIYSSFGQKLNSEAPTLFVSKQGAGGTVIFNGFVNAIDLTGFGYKGGTAGGQIGQTGTPIEELDRGFLGNPTVDTTSMWATANYSYSNGTSGSTFPDDYTITSPTRVNDLQIQGYDNVPRDGDSSQTKTGPANWLFDPRLAISMSKNVVFPEERIQRISEFVTAASSTSTATNAAGQTIVPDAVTGATTSDWSDPEYALLDILYLESSDNEQKVMDSMVVAIDGAEIERDSGAYLMSYDTWARQGDENSIQLFVEALHNAGVTYLGENFTMPAMDPAVMPEFLYDLFSTVLWDQSATNIADWDPTSGAPFTVTKQSTFDNSKFDAKLVAHLMLRTGWTGSVTTPAPSATAATGTWTRTNPDGSESGLVRSAFSTSQYSNHGGKLPGDPVFSNTQHNRNMYLYDFYNQTMHFKTAPRNGASVTIKLINYTVSNPAGNLYYVVSPTDRDFPERNQNKTKTINRFVVRESDVLKPWDYHVSATMHEIDSNAIINPQEQLTITADRDFVFSFPTQLTTQRFYYPQSELDMITISSADFSTQSGTIEIDKYGDSDGIKSAGIFAVDGEQFNPDTSLSDYPYAGHLAPTGEKYYWKRNKRKYEGMMSTLPFGNGMRVFLQVSGSSIKFTDVGEGTAPV